MAANGDRLADLECHQIFTHGQRSGIGLPRFGEHIVDGRRWNFFAANQDNVREGRKLRFRLSEDQARLARRGMVPDDPLDVGFVGSWRSATDRIVMADGRFRKKNGREWTRPVTRLRHWELTNSPARCF
jgi:hypothetical protein